MRVGMRGRANTTLLAGGLGLAGPVHAPFWCGLITGPRRALRAGWLRGWRAPVLRALAGLFRALAGHCGGLAMLGRARAGLRCLFSLYETTVLGGHTAFPSVWHGLGLSVWHSPSMASAERMDSSRIDCLLLIYRIMKPGQLAR